MSQKMENERDKAENEAERARSERNKMERKVRQLEEEIAIKSKALNELKDDFKNVIEFKNQ